MVLYKKRKICRFCINTDIKLDYKEPETLSNYITERGKKLSASQDSNPQPLDHEACTLPLSYNSYPTYHRCTKYKF